MIPLVHDLSDETVVVFGGGPVGARKARRFAREARTVVVSPAFADRDFGDAERVRAAPAPDEVSDWVERFAPALVVAATDDDDVNDAVVAAARDAGALVNRADRSGERDAGSVVVPATVEDGDVSVAITTGGASPALSKHLRERVEAELAGAGEMAALTAELRAELKASDRSPAERRDAIRAVVRDPSVWKALRTGDANPRQEAARVIRDTQRGDS
ncbi:MULTISPECIES: precorrin-2 dehydrogenase/sirohydrochlorin ferrochelatase family protein [Haloferax]|uniref:precorrin-2 dehydrogenase n=3 Tax=Haloferax volcanii TaxID=2246 RepID=A0A6C0UVR9_HALVO|nr:MULTISPECIES: NAD(P)-dependent oxidoreductase [Haloferax]ELZ75600.1 siroheme synthase [Haloferax lucentense DSM 14919]ELZ87004.1 siroheme synthase [Haloferax alexandrinus JCM 10717]MBC9987000.1 bifunctional precorrin-2 dehydrogenase/sirohydrochlorin ferrochelatase [Haloferax sp. AS1]NLV03894.1 bifunctional precorrin-2 dehydrogenase/sirohydrochlorin ferrochelatase [Haloferax alexandrinus]QIB79300.1 bifunctional precorrin-2 dehydrogenase/sirohydrochlorin ferrochelatase [Haloferax alexandrinus